MKFVFQAPCWQSKFSFPLEFYIEFCISSPLLALEICIPARVGGVAKPKARTRAVHVWFIVFPGYQLHLQIDLNF